MECQERAGSLVWLSNEHDKWTAADWALCATLHIYGRVVYWLLVFIGDNSESLDSCAYI